MTTQAFRPTSLAEALTELSARFVVRPRPPEAPAVPPCPHCAGHGFVLRAVAVDDPRFGQLVRCRCRALPLRADLHAAIAAALGGRTATLATFERSRPLVAYLDRDKQRVLLEQQQHSLDRAIAAVERYIDTMPRPWLYLYGPPGSGKTHLALAVYHALAGTGQAGFLTAAGCSSYLRAGVEEGTLDVRLNALQALDLLVLDDLGSERPTSWGLARLYDLIEQRASQRLATVITSNLALPALCPTEPSRDEELGWQRIASRIAERIERPLVLLASDYRYLHWSN